MFRVFYKPVWVSLGACVLMITQSVRLTMSKRILQIPFCSDLSVWTLPTLFHLKISLHKTVRRDCVFHSGLYQLCPLVPRVKIGIFIFPFALILLPSATQLHHSRGIRMQISNLRNKQFCKWMASVGFGVFYETGTLFVRSVLFSCFFWHPLETSILHVILIMWQSHIRHEAHASLSGIPGLRPRNGLMLSQWGSCGTTPPPPLISPHGAVTQFIYLSCARGWCQIQRAPH